MPAECAMGAEVGSRSSKGGGGVVLFEQSSPRFDQDGASQRERERGPLNSHQLPAPSGRWPAASQASRPAANLFVSPYDRPRLKSAYLQHLAYAPVRPRPCHASHAAHSMGAPLIPRLQGPVCVVGSLAALDPPPRDSSHHAR
ncbi:hypothetical protein ANO11243_062650 [Dothideomycetidae sp. 11243]|nr:hypothetical protein ANO11243_062650 [fungal sp. No.11243]